MPTSKEQQEQTKKEQEIGKKVKIIVSDFTKETNEACKSKVETRFAPIACKALASFVNSILRLKDEAGETVHKPSYNTYKEFKDEYSLKLSFKLCDDVKKMFDGFLRIIGGNTSLSIGDFDYKIYGDVKKNVNKILKHLEVLENREDVLVERCRKCLNLIFEKKQINNTIVEKLISWLEKICTIRFGDNKAKWPKNKKKGLAGLASILSSMDNLEFDTKLEMIIKFISQNVNKRSCLWPLVENSKQVHDFLENDWKSRARYNSVIKSSNQTGENKHDVSDNIKNRRNIEQKYKLLNEYLNKVYKNIENTCSQLKNINSANFYDDNVIMLENLNRGAEGIKSQNFLTTFEVNSSPDGGNFISNFLNMLNCLRGRGFIQPLPKFFFNSCYALDIKIGGKSVTDKTAEQLFPNFYKLLNNK